MIPKDITALVAAGITEEAGWWKDFQLYNVDMLDLVAGDPDRRATVARIVAEREAWIAGSITVDQAAEQLGWRWQDVRRIAAERDVRIDKDRRIARSAVDGWHSIPGRHRGHHLRGAFGSWSGGGGGARSRWRCLIGLSVGTLGAPGRWR